MQATCQDAALMRMLGAAHHGLLERAQQAVDPSPEAVLDLGAAVLFHGAAERILSLNPLVDAEVQAGFAAEHGRLADDLSLLESLWKSDPGSSDVDILSRALFDRLREHLSRDERVFYRRPGGGV